jgi:hypothetical protein
MRCFKSAGHPQRFLAAFSGGSGSIFAQVLTGHGID